MANNCYFEMKICGTKTNCQKWLNKMNSYGEENHFWRIFDSTVYDEGESENEYFMCIYGDCAWSLESCCRGGYSNGIDLFEVNSRNLSIKMEAFSEEPGCCFQEHYFYDNGVCIEDECVDWYEYIWDKGDFSNLEDFKKEYELSDSITESDFNSDGEYHIGGFESWEFSI